MANTLIAATIEICTQYNVTVAGAYPYSKVTASKKIVYDYRGTNTPPGPPPSIDIPLDVFVEMISGLMGFYNMLHNEISYTVQAVLWVRANLP